MLSNLTSLQETRRIFCTASLVAITTLNNSRTPSSPTANPWKDRGESLLINVLARYWPLLIKPKFAEHCSARGQSRVPVLTLLTDYLHLHGGRNCSKPRRVTERPTMK